jgi:hypothetical protein
VKIVGFSTHGKGAGSGLLAVLRHKVGQGVGGGETSSYDQTTTIDWLGVMVGFDWEYQA